MPHPHVRNPRNAPKKVQPEPHAPCKRQLLLDVSHTAAHDVKTGIQRVVRSLLFELINNPPPGIEVEPVYTPLGQKGFLYARGYKHKIGLGPEGEDAPIHVRPGDIFLVIELDHKAVVNQPEIYRNMHQAGVKIFAVVYDLIPIRTPHFCATPVAFAHAKWLSILAEGDGLICISRTVADDVVDWLEQYGPHRKAPLPVGWFHLGADLGASIPTQGMPKNSDELLDIFRSRPTFLMVGTLEPRKSQREAVEAFDILWDRGLDINLVFVGKNGWKVDKLAYRLRNTHPERGRHLFWIEGGSDEYLSEIYRASICLLYPSRSEGFGLPLIEAAQHGLPILVRDLPVFREVAGDHASYFTGATPQAMAGQIEDWLTAWQAGAVPDSRGMPWLTWEESTKSLLRVILDGGWYTTWEPSPSRPSPEAKPAEATRTWDRTIGVDARVLWTEDQGRASVREYTLAHLNSLATARPAWRFLLIVDVPPHTPEELRFLLERPNVEVCVPGKARTSGLELLHVPETPPGTFPALGKLIPEGLPTTTLVHTLGVPESRDFQRFMRPGRALLTSTEALRQHLLGATDVKGGDLETVKEGPGPVEAIPREVAVVRREWGLEHPFFLIQGDLSAEHDMGVALAAFRALVAVAPAHLVVLEGLETKEMQRFRQQARAFGAERLRFTGNLDPGELAALHQGATAFMCPGVSASFPTSALRALTLGCPVIAYPEGALPEVVGNAALYVPTGDIQALADAMKALIDDPDLAATLRERGLQRAEAFTWEAVAERTVRCWARLWEAPSNRGHKNPQHSDSVPGLVRWEGPIQEGGLAEALASRGFILERIADFPAVEGVNEANVHVRHQWPPDLAPPPSGCWVMSFPEESELLHPAWLGILREEVDEIWVADPAMGERCLAAGIPPERVLRLETSIGAMAHFSWLIERITELSAQKPRRWATPRLAPPPRATALIYRLDWRETEWIEIVLAFVSAFEPAEPVALVLEMTWGEPVSSIAAAERRILDLISRVKKLHFPQIILVGPEDSLEKTLEDFPIREMIPHGRRVVEELTTFAGLRFAGTRMEITRT